MTLFCSNSIESLSAVKLTLTFIATTVWNNNISHSRKDNPVLIDFVNNQLSQSHTQSSHIFIHIKNDEGRRILYDFNNGFLRNCQ